MPPLPPLLPPSFCRLHVAFCRKMLPKLSPAFREEVFLLKTDENGLNPLMWAAKKGHADTAELILSFGGRLGNNANTKVCRRARVILAFAAAPLHRPSDLCRSSAPDPLR